MSRRWIRCLASVIACAFALIGPGARSEEWPSKPVRLIVPFAPGGGADVTARLLTPLLTQILKQQIIVDNRGGGGGVIGAAAVATVPADGYTVLYGTPGPLVTNQYLMKRLPYDPEKDFAPVNEAFHAALREPIVLERFAAAGKKAETTSPEQLGEILKAERVKWRAIIERAGIQPE